MIKNNEQKNPAKELIAELLSKILTDFTYNLLVLKMSNEKAFIKCYKNISKQCNMCEENAANLIRIAVGVYIKEDDFVEKALKSLKGGDLNEN